jgi:tetratricopeptide (TPR) repeat protein
MCDRPGNSPEMLNKCGWLYFKQKQYDKSIQAFQQTLKDVPNDEYAWVWKIVSLRWQFDFDKAAQAIQGALTRLPQNINILHQQGYLYLDQYQYEKAIQIFDRTLNDLPGNEYTWQGKIICLRLMYRFNEAEETARKALKQLPQNITILNEEISLYCDQGQYDKAIAICDEILKIDRANEDAFSQKIGVLRSLNRFSDAEELIQEALTRLPRNVAILNQQGYLYADQQQYEAALKAFRQVLFIDPTNVGAFVGKIQALRSQGNLDQANQALEEMCDHPGNSSEMLNQCGWSYFGQKQYDKAIQAFKQTLKYFPYDEEAWVGKIASLQWQPDFDKPDFDKAEQAIEESHKCLPRSQQIQAWQIRLHLHRRQYSQVIKDCQEILNKNPSHETALLGTIEAYREQSHFKDAGREQGHFILKGA